MAKETLQEALERTGDEYTNVIRDENLLINAQLDGNQGEAEISGKIELSDGSMWEATKWVQLTWKREESQ